MVGSISHDLRTPLNATITTLEAAECDKKLNA